MGIDPCSVPQCPAGEPAQTQPSSMPFSSCEHTPRRDMTPPNSSSLTHGIVLHHLELLSESWPRGGVEEAGEGGRHESHENAPGISSAVARMRTSALLPWPWWCRGRYAIKCGQSRKQQVNLHLDFKSATTSEFGNSPAGLGRKARRRHLFDGRTARRLLQPSSRIVSTTSTTTTTR